MQDDDFGSANFIRQMERGLEHSERMISLLSQSYQESEFCRAEYANFLGEDTNNLKKRLIVLRVADYKPVGLLKTIAYTDLVPVLEDPEKFKVSVLGAINNHQNSSNENSANELASVFPYIEKARDVVEELTQLNSERRLVDGVTLVLDRIEGLGQGTLDIQRLARLSEQFESFAREASQRELKTIVSPFSLDDFQEKLSRFRETIKEQNSTSITGATVPNDWQIDEVRHKKMLDDLFEEIKLRKSLLHKIPDPSIRLEALHIFEELEIELHRHPLYLQHIDKIRDRLEKLDKDIFHELIINCQLLLGKYAQRLEPGSIFRDARSTPEMVVIPPGRFEMGSQGDEGQEGERPLHEVRIGYFLAVARYAATFGEWDEYTKANPQAHNPGDLGWGRDKRPVIDVSWDDVQGYLKWLKQESGHNYRLLSEAEWEYSTTAGTKTKYWWGDKITHDLANHDGGPGQTVPVDSFEPNPWGLYNVHGNVWEWCEDYWYSNYNNAPADGSPWLESGGGDPSGRMLRGGSWISVYHDLRSRSRNWLNRGDRDVYVGFRVARTS